MSKNVKNGEDFLPLYHQVIVEFEIKLPLGCFLNDLGSFGIDTNTDQWTTSGRPVDDRTKGSGARRRNKRRDVSWQNGSLQRKSRLDNGMQ